jgi:hypothetical protein
MTTEANILLHLACLRYLQEHKISPTEAFINSNATEIAQETNEEVDLRIVNQEIEFWNIYGEMLTEMLTEIQGIV